MRLSLVFFLLIFFQLQIRVNAQMDSSYRRIAEADSIRRIDSLKKIIPVNDLKCIAVVITY